MPPPVPFTRDWVGTWEASELLGIAARTIRVWVIGGRLRDTVRVGQTIFIPRAEIERVGRERREEQERRAVEPPPRQALIRRARERSLRSLARSELFEEA